jgi:two-component system alkaline phosphatase synthesis response regulator PhoP
VFARHFDLVLLDVMLPARGGFEILREMRAQGIASPVLMLTVRGDESDKVLGFDLGADDYVTKPFSLRELLARVRALLRRGRPAPPDATAKTPPTPDRFVIGDAEVDLAAYRVTLDGTAHPLSPREAAILALLHREAGRVVSRDRFLDEVWGREVYVGHRTVDTHVLNLRQKIERDPRQPIHILTVHGVGYRLVVEPGDPGA